MENKSFEQLYRMLRLINHKQVSKINIKEVIKKVDSNKILLKENQKEEVGFDLDALFQDDSIAKMTRSEVESGSSPEYYANNLSSNTGGDRAFDMPYRMWLLRIPYGNIALKIDDYNDSVEEDERIHFDFDANKWIKDTRERNVTSGTIGIPGNLRKTGKFILEFMSRVYTGKLNPAEKKFDSVGTKVFDTVYAKKVASNFIKTWLSVVVFEVAKKANKAVFKDEIDDRIMLQAKEASVDYIMLILNKSYDPTKANFYAWSLSVMNNIIKNQFRTFGERSLSDTDYLVSYLDSLKYPYALKSNKEFTFRVYQYANKKQGKQQLTPDDWAKIKQESGASYAGEPISKGEKDDEVFIFNYQSANDMLNDIMSANEISNTDNIKTLSPLFVRYIGDVPLRDAAFKSGLRASGEKRHENIAKVKIDNVVVSYDKSKINSDKPEEALTFDFPPKWSKEDKTNWIQFQRNSNWEKFTEFYDNKSNLEDAAFRSISMSNVTDDDINTPKSEGSFSANLAVNSEMIKLKKDTKELEKELEKSKAKNNPELVNRIQQMIKVNNDKLDRYEDSGTKSKEAIKKLNTLKQELVKAIKGNDEDRVKELNKDINFYEEEAKERNNVTVNYTVVPGHVGKENEIQITSIVDEQGNEITVDDDMMYQLQDRAKEQVESGADVEGKEKASIGTTEIPDFDETGEERVKRIMGTKKFFDKFLNTISNTENGADIMARFKTIPNRIANEPSPMLTKEFYSFIGDLIAETILAVGKPSRRGGTPDTPSIGATDKEKNIKNIYSKVYEEHLSKLQNKLSPEDFEKIKRYFTLNDDNLKVLSRAITAFMYANKKNKKSSYAGMGLDEAKKILSGLIRKIIKENLVNEFGTEFEADLDEERISNHEGSKKVNGKENFIGSQVFGEDIGDVGKESNWNDGMYGVFSYGEQFPIYIYTNVSFHDQDGNLKNKDGKFRWFHNIEPYRFDIDGDGDREIMSSVEKHKELLKPNSQTHGLTTATLTGMINSFKNKHKIKELSHVSILPGEGAGIHYGDSDHSHDKRKD